MSPVSMIRGNSPLYKWRITRETRATEDFSAFYFVSFRQLIRSPGIVPTTNQRCAKIWPHQHRRERLCVRPDTYVQGWVVYKIKCCDCQSTYISEIGRNLSTRLSKLNGDQKWWRRQSRCWTPFTDETSHRLGLCDMYYVFYRLLSTTHFRKLFTNLEETPLNRSQQLPAPIKRLIGRIK